MCLDAYLLGLTECSGQSGRRLTSNTLETMIFCWSFSLTPGPSFRLVFFMVNESNVVLAFSCAWAVAEGVPVAIVRLMWYGVTEYLLLMLVTSELVVGPRRDRFNICSDSIGSGKVYVSGQRRFTTSPSRLLSLTLRAKHR